jgi:drug/metabolite transporter (DMT)-like permease
MQMSQSSKASFPAIAAGGPILALLSAALFGASTPCAKIILGAGVDPWLLAGLLYLGSGVGLGLLHLGARIHARRTGQASREAPLTRADLPWLALVVLFGGLIGPVLLMYGLARVPAASAALLLNLEAIATLAIAWVVFREHVDRRLFLGAVAIVAGAALLSWQGGSLRAGTGALAIAGACLAWGIDNNLTRKLSAADPVQITLFKGLIAGAVNLVIALLRGARLPSPGAVGAAGLVGLIGYGASLVLFVLALRQLGAARTGAYFSTAPFIGAVLAVLLLAEPVSLRLIGAGVLMAIGVYLHLSELHEHEHSHEAMTHEHRHRHDETHRHEHSANDPPGEPHSHWHVHAPLVHSHPHYPDLHHRHRHRGARRRH